MQPTASSGTTRQARVWDLAPSVTVCDQTYSAPDVGWKTSIPECAVVPDSPLLMHNAAETASAIIHSHGCSNIPQCP